MEQSDSQHAVVVISSHVARGSVGNRASVFALESLGLPVWAVPTVLLPWHPGHGTATRIIPDDEAFGAFLSDLSRSKFIGEVSAVLTGYMGSVEQVLAVEEFVRQTRKVNSNLFYMCDPVIGDESGLYVPDEIAIAIRDHLVPLADIITPNRFELEWLMAQKFSSNEQMVDALRISSVPKAVVTSAFGMLKGSTGNLYVDDESAWLAEHRIIQDAPNGTGDLTASLFLARYLSGMKPEDSLRVTTQSVYELLARTAKRGADELTLELDTECLRRPASMVQVRAMGLGGLPKRPA